MNIKRSNFFRKTQMGFSLLETLVGLMIGLLALMASLQAFQTLSINQSENAQAIRLDADARQLLNSIALLVREAGSSSLYDLSPGTVKLTGSIGQAIQMDASGGIQLTHASKAYIKGNQSCLYLSNVSSAISRSTYYLGNDQTLRCNPTDNPSIFYSRTQPVMDKVKELSWQLAIASDSGLRWLSVRDATKQGLLPRVIGVQLCLHLIGPKITLVQVGSPQDCSGNAVVNDSLLHVIRTRTIWLASKTS